MGLLENLIATFGKEIATIRSEISGINFQLSSLRKSMSVKDIHDWILSDPKYLDPKKLTKYEYKVFSQNGEDGLIHEIFNRIGLTNQFFVEFGVGDGLENNTCALLADGWEGRWIEGDPDRINAINNKFVSIIKEKKLKIKHAFIEASNIEALFEELNVPKEFDFLSIDVDRNDYWIWESIQNYSPRVVSIEYNSSYGPFINWIIKHDPKAIWDKGSSYFGASLKAYEILGNKKGYKLVGCNFTGTNAFFVRQDLVEDKFLAPFTSENYFESPKYNFWPASGHRSDFGEFERAENEIK